MADRKVALVTGAGGHGIGRAIAEMLAQEGYDVMIHCGRSLASGEALCDELRARYGVQAYAVQADLQDKDAYKKIFEAFDEKFERMDVFVNNAGITIHQPFLTLKEETFDTIANVNYRSCIFGVKAAAQRMIAKAIPGKIVVITSIQGMAVLPRSTVYGSVKAALIHFVRHAAMELAQFGIRVNGLAPGPVLTDRNGPITEEQRKGAEADGARMVTGAWPPPENIADGVKFLISDGANFMIGHNLAIECGMYNQYFTNESFDQELPRLSTGQK